MKASKAGIWMDHDHAYLIEFTTKPITATRTESPIKASKNPNMRFGERRMHTTEQGEQSAFYKELSELISGYKEVILFGPSTARVELFNLLIANHNLREVDVKTAHTDKLTPRQMNAFVRKYFSGAKVPA